MELPQIIATGIYQSKTAVKNKTITDNRKVTMFELELPLEPGGTSYIDHQRQVITPSLVICAKPGQIRHTRLPFSCYYVHMIVKDDVLNRTLCRLPTFMEPAHPEHYRSLFSAMCAHAGSTLETEEIMAQGILLQLIHTLYREFAGKPGEISQEQQQLIESVTSYLKNHLTADLSLSTIAAHSSYSPVYFHHFFKNATGKTLHSYVEELRIKKAVKLLLTTSMNLTEIAYACGFSSQSYFSYAFKRCMGLTPRTFARKKFQQYEQIVSPIAAKGK